MARQKFFNSDSYCAMPFVGVNVTSGGNMRYCCFAEDLLQEDGFDLAISQDTLKGAWNSHTMKETRRKMIAGEEVPGCSRCVKEEDFTSYGPRVSMTSEWINKIGRAGLTKLLQEAKANDFKLLENPVYLDLRLGNLCNLKCRMCGPTDSHSWYEDWLQVYGGDGFQDTHGYVKLEKNSKGRLDTNDYNWFESDKFWNHIESNIPNMQHVYMAGGEPLMIERHYDFLQKCVDMGQAKKMTIEYNTNMTNLQSRVLDLWKHFKTVRVGASVDGMGKVVEYQRHPAKWPIILRNLQTVDSLDKNVQAWLACTVTTLNVFHIPEFIKWKIMESNFKKINSSKKLPVLTIHVAHSPASSCIKILPPEMKKLVREKYDAFKDWVISEKLDPDIEAAAIQIINNIVQFMMSEDRSEKWNWFIEYTKQLDKLRDQTIVDIVPEYESYF